MFREDVSERGPATAVAVVGASALETGVARGPRPRPSALARALPFYFIAPTVGLLALVVAYPIGYSFWVSLHHTEYLRVGPAVGLAHYRFLLGDEVVRRDVVISLKYLIGSLAGAVPLGLLLAMVLNQRLRFGAWFRTICALPWVISQTVTALLWTWLLDPSFGPVNYLLDAAGFARVNFVGNETTALPVLVAVNVWMSYPFAMISSSRRTRLTHSTKGLEAASRSRSSPLW